jgi:hypothetical protein
VLEQFAILEQELSAFSEEYRHRHYTACALRIGRTLEHVVYALARGWGVNVNRARLQVLSDLGNSFDQLSGAVIAYSTTDENERTKRRKVVENRLLEIQKILMQLHSDIHSDLHPEPTDIPVNIERSVPWGKSSPPRESGASDGRARKISTLQSTTLQLAIKAAGGNQAAMGKFLDWIDEIETRATAVKPTQFPLSAPDVEVLRAAYERMKQCDTEKPGE